MKGINEREKRMGVKMSQNQKLQQSIIEKKWTHTHTHTHEDYCNSPMRNNTNIVEFQKTTRANSIHM